MTASSWFETGLTHFWQVTALVLIAAWVSRTSLRRHPHLVYLLWLLVIVKCLTPAVWSSRVGVFSWALAERPPHVTSTTTSGAASHPADPLDAFGGAPDFSRTSGAVSPSQYVATSAPSEASSSRLDGGNVSSGPAWVGAILTVWLIGVAVTATCAATKWLVCWRIIRRYGTTADESLRQRMSRLAERCGAHRRLPRLIVLDRQYGPGTVGLLRPTIVLPRRLCTTASADEVDAVIAHELVHVRRRDVVAAWLQVLAGIVWWFYPLVWWANRQVSRWRETVCDDETLARHGIAPRVYGHALLRVLDMRVAPRAGLQLSMTSSGLTRNRLQRIMRPSSPRRCTPNWCWALFMIAAAGVLPGAALRLNAQPAAETATGAHGDSETTNEPSESGPNPVFKAQFGGTFPSSLDESTQPPPPDAQSIRLEIAGRAIDSRGSGLGGVTIFLTRHRGGHDDMASQMIQTETDASGRFTFPVVTFDVRSIGGTEDITLVGIAPDRAPFWVRRRATVEFGGVTLRPIPQTDTLGDVFRATFGSGSVRSFTLDSAPVSLELVATESTAIAGRVWDDSGRPVSDMEVSVTDIVRADQPHTALQVVDAAAYGLLARTDTNGQWRMDRIPSGCWVSLRIKHPSYPTFQANLAADPSAQVPTDGAAPLPVAQADVRLPKLHPVTIVVRDRTNRRTVPATELTIRHRLAHLNMLVTATTDRLGRAAFTLPAGRFQVQLRPPLTSENPCLPDSAELDVRDDESNQSVKVQAPNGCFLDLRVQDDTTGQPIRDILVRSRTDPDNPHSYLDGFGLMMTDRSGRCRAMVKPGKSMFKIDSNSLLEHGYEVVNPAAQPLELAAGETLAYTFRLRPMGAFRPPLPDDSTAQCSPEHQRAAARLRAKGAFIRTDVYRHFNDTDDAQQGSTMVQIPQSWTGTADDMADIADLEYVWHVFIAKMPTPPRVPDQRPAPVVDDDWMREIGKLKNVRFLVMERCEASESGFQSLRGCVNLQALVLHSDTFDGHGLAHLADLPGLRSLKLKCPMTAEGLAETKPLISLHDLYVDSQRNITPGLAGLTNPELTGLVLTQTDDRVFSLVMDLPKLNWLAVGGPGITDEGLGQAARLSELRRLHLINTSVTDSGLKPLAESSITHLQLEGQQFTDACIDRLTGLATLRSLSLVGTRVTDTGVRKMQSQRPGVTVTRRGPSQGNRGVFGSIWP